MTSEFRPSRESDLPRLRGLWKAAFGDEDEFLDMFYRTAYAPERSLVYREDGALLAALYWLDCAFHGQKLAYLYAFAVTPERQNQGLGGRMMEAYHRQLEQQGYAASVLVPGNPRLVRYYQRFGYRGQAFHREFTVFPGHPVSLAPICGARYALLRRQYLPENGIRQEGENLAFLDALARFYEGPGFIAAISREGRSCLELLPGDPGQAESLTAALGLETCRIRCPGDDVPYAMIRPVGEGNIDGRVYLGFGFD